MTNFVVTTIQTIAGILLQFCQAITALLTANVNDLIVNGLTVDFNNPFGVSLADISLPGLGAFGQGVIDLFTQIPGVTFDLTFLQFLFNVAFLTVVIRIINSVIVR